MPPQPPFDLTSRHALVTGCGSAHGIGFASARMLARLGARISITSTTDRIHERAAELEGEAFSFVADLTDRAQASALVAGAREAHGPIDIVVNAAGMVQTGVAAGESLFAELSPAALDHQLEITLKTAFNATQAVLPEMIERGHGRIVMVSSVTGPLVTAPGSTAYATAKAHALILGGRVCRRPGRRHQWPGDRGDHHDPAVPALDHLREHRLGRVERGLQRDLELVVEGRR